MMEQYTVVSFYRFIDFDEKSLETVTNYLNTLAKNFNINGLIISALEGLNGTVASDEAGIGEFTQSSRHLFGLKSLKHSDLDWKNEILQKI
jgi:predicted sulfurtransferase